MFRVIGLAPKQALNGAFYTYKVTITIDTIRIMRERGRGMAKRKMLNTSTDIKRYISSLINRVENEEIEPKKADTLSNMAYKIQMSIAQENKEKEIAETERLANALEQARKGK